MVKKRECQKRGEKKRMARKVGNVRQYITYEVQRERLALSGPSGFQPITLLFVFAGVCVFGHVSTSILVSMRSHWCKSHSLSLCRHWQLYPFVCTDLKGLYDVVCGKTIHLSKYDPLADLVYNPYSLIPFIHDGGKKKSYSLHFDFRKKE